VRFIQSHDLNFHGSLCYRQVLERMGKYTGLTCASTASSDYESSRRPRIVDQVRSRLSTAPPSHALSIDTPRATINTTGENKE
jgi:hypothetical protein